MLFPVLGLALGCLAALFVFLYLAADRLDTLKG